MQSILVKHQVWKLVSEEDRLNYVLLETKYKFTHYMPNKKSVRSREVCVELRQERFFPQKDLCNPNEKKINVCHGIEYEHLEHSNNILSVSVNLDINWGCIYTVYSVYTRNTALKKVCTRQLV